MKTIKQFFKINSLLAWFGLANLVAAIFLLLLAQTDDRLLHGISVWIKPAKFHLTVVFYVWTMAVLLQYLPNPKHISTITKYIMLCMTVEVVLIDLQAARGVASHFNHTSIPDALVYSTMGIFIMLNTFVAMYAARLFFKEPVQLSATLLWGIRLGLIIFVIGSLEGGVMSAVNQHSVGTTDDASGIFFLNWNKEGGDLRIAHFLGIHALQVIPLFAWLLEKYLRKDSVKIVIAFSVLYAALFTGLLVHALMVRPLF